MKTIFTTIFSMFVTTFLWAQAPQGIPYQAVMRNADGSVMASSSVSLTFMIHDGSATGAVVYQESHALTSNAQGLVSCVVGTGVVAQGNFAQINWGGGAKFLQVMMGSTDLGTQQMLSVPYALYAEDVNVRVSVTGDSLFIGDQVSIVPGVSAANPVSMSNYGSALLPGNTTCQSEYISVISCGGQDSLLYHDRYYDLVEIGGQCWFAENLATDKYSNGDLISTGLTNTEWNNTTSGAYAIYDNNPVNDAIYGKLYNWYTTVDTRGVCPTGWHVPSDCEWMFLEGVLGLSIISQVAMGSRGQNIELGGKLKDSIFWIQPNLLSSLSSGYNALPSGYRDFYGGYYSLGTYSFIWTKNESTSELNYGIYRVLNNNDLSVQRLHDHKQDGFSIRCIRD
jgi:uncharacterized protein (TIGR02145 family)